MTETRDISVFDTPPSPDGRSTGLPDPDLDRPSKQEDRKVNETLIDQTLDQFIAMDDYTQQEIDEVSMSRYRELFKRPEDYPGRTGLVIGSAYLFKSRTDEAVKEAESMIDAVAIEDSNTSAALKNLVGRQKRMAGLSGDEREKFEEDQREFVHQLVDEFGIPDKSGQADRDVLLFLHGASMGLAVNSKSRLVSAEAALELLQAEITLL